MQVRSWYSAMASLIAFFAEEPAIKNGEAEIKLVISTIQAAANYCGWLMVAAILSKYSRKIITIAYTSINE